MEQTWLEQLHEPAPKLTLLDKEPADSRKPAPANDVPDSIWRYVLLGCLPASCTASNYYDESASRLFAEKFRVSQRNFFCFYGPRGAGKRRHALAYAGTLQQLEDFPVQFLHGTGLQLCGATDSDTKRRVEELFDYVQRRRTVLLLEKLSAGDGREFLWNCVAQKCAERKAAAQNSPLLTVFVIEDNETVLQQDWTRGLSFCRFALPGMAERLAFFRDPAHGIPPKPGRPEAEWMAEQTEGFNYVQLHDLVRLMRMIVKAKAATSSVADWDTYGSMLRGGMEKFDQELFACLIETLRNQPTWKEAGYPFVQVNLNGGVDVPMAQRNAEKQSPAVPDHYAELFGVESTEDEELFLQMLKEHAL